jgi:hypothetical protein
MSAMIISQIEAIRAHACRRWSTIDELLAIAAGLKEAAPEADRTRTNRLEAGHAQRKGSVVL